METVFNQVYLTGRWGKEGNGSGPGSAIAYAQNAINFLKEIIRKYQIRSITDVSCGGMLWWIEVLKDFPEVSFNGYDISSVIIERNKKSFVGKPLWKFGVRNAVDDSFESVDLMVCRHTMMHLGLDNAARILQNIRNSHCKYYLLTSHPSVASNSDKNRIPLFENNGAAPVTEQGFRFTHMNMALPPFNLTLIDSVVEPQSTPEILALYENGYLSKPQNVPKTSTPNTIPQNTLKISVSDNNRDICVITTICGTKFKHLHLAPSDYDCYLYTNNPGLKSEATRKKWKFQLLPPDIILSDDEILSSQQSKYTKFLGCDYPIYNKILYVDHKLRIQNEDIKKLSALQNKPIMLRTTPREKTSVWDEFNDAHQQERYQRFEPAVLKYIGEKVARGYSENFRICNTGLILYNITESRDKILTFVTEIMRDLDKVGTPECQIIWAIVAQKYSDLIQTVNTDAVPIQREEPLC